MRSSRILAALALVISAFAIVPGTAAPAVLDADLFRPGMSPRAIVAFRHDVNRATIRRLAAAGVTKAVVLDSIDAVVVAGTPAAYRAIATWSDVTAVDADSRIVFDNNGAKRDTKVSSVRSGARPLKRSYTGKGVTVAVMDTGIDQTHPDFAGRIVKNVNFEFSWLADQINDGDYTDRVAEATGNGIDSGGHGTHVAGIVGGSGAAAKGGVDFSGVAPEVSLVNLKIADAHQGFFYDLGWEANALIAYEWLIKNRKNPAFPGGIRVVNNSWAVVEADDEVEPISLIVQAAYQRGIVNVFSSGNSGPGENTQNPGPNRLKEVIAVGAACKTAEYEATDTCAAGGIADFSSRGKTVDIVAPGVLIWSAAARHSVLSPLGTGPTPGTASDPAATANNVVYYVSFSGTSMSSPHVSGIVALMLQANPKLTPAQVEKILVTTSRDRGKRGFDTTWGYGLVDAHAAVAKAIAPVRRR